MEPLTKSPPIPPPLVSQTHNPSLDPSSCHSQCTKVSDIKDVNSSDIQNNTKRKRRRARLNSSVSSEATVVDSTVQSVSVSSSSTDVDSTSTLDNSKLTLGDKAVPSDSSSPTSSALGSKIRSTTNPHDDSKESPSPTQVSTPQNEKTKEEENFGTVKDILPQSKPTDNTNTGQSKTEKVPKSSLRKTSSTRSALSLVFDISQNQTISRSTSAASSRCESRQGKYHIECQPVEDPDLKVENWARVRRARSPRVRSSSSSRPGSEASLLGRRESVTNLIFAGQSQIDGEEGGLEAIYWKKLQLQYTPRGSLLFGRMATSLKENDVTPGNFNVKVDEDYSLSRQSKVNTPTSSGRGSSHSPPRSRTGFLYQVTDFDRLSKDVPPFVRHYAQKNGKMITESFILRLNYLRRRRQLGENSSTINIGNSNNSGHGHSHSHNAGNSLNSVGKRSSPTAV